MAKRTVLTYPSADGSTTIHALRWLPDSSPRAVFQIAHGIGGSAEKFSDLAEAMTVAGFAVYANDHLGHGLSVTDESRRGHFADEDGWFTAVRDMMTLNRHIRSTHPWLPVILFGHSMGSFMCRTALIRHCPQLAGCILSGTGQLESKLIRTASAFINTEIRKNGPLHRVEGAYNLCLKYFCRGISDPITPYDWVSSVRSYTVRLSADKESTVVPTAAFCRDLFSGISFNTDPDNLIKMNKNTPVLFISGNRDPVGDYGKGVMRAYGSFVDAGMENAELRLIPNGRHELLNDVTRTVTLEKILNWSKEKCGI